MRNLEDSIWMAELAVHEGIYQIIVTPHYVNGSFNNRKSDIIQKVMELHEFLSEKGVP